MSTAEIEVVKKNITMRVERNEMKIETHFMKVAAALNGFDERYNVKHTYMWHTKETGIWIQ